MFKFRNLKNLKTSIEKQDVQKVRPARPQAFLRAERTTVREHEKMPRTPLAGFLNILPRTWGGEHRETATEEVALGVSSQDLLVHFFEVVR